MSTSEVGVAVAQFAAGDDPDQNLAVIASLAAQARERGASVVVVPEYASYFRKDMGQDWVDNAQTLDGPFVGVLEALADELGLHIVAGLVESAERNRFSNTTVAVAPADGVVATYRKIHLYDAFGAKESDWVVPGPVAEPELFEVDGVRFGLQACYDVRFPEVTRCLADAGADVVCLPAEWVRGPLKEHHWRTLVTARALENTLYVAAAGRTPPIGVGNSMVVDPMGVTLAGLGEEQGVAVSWVSTERIREARNVNPALALRRFAVTPRDGDEN